MAPFTGSKSWEPLARFSMRGLAHVLNNHIFQQPPGEITKFNRAIFKRATINPGEVPRYFDNNPDVIRTELPKYLYSAVKETWVQHVRKFKDTDSQNAKRASYDAVEMNSSGHSIISYSFQKHPNAKNAVEDPRLFLHVLSSFIAGGGILASPENLVEITIQGRKLQRFPFEKINDLYPKMQDYSAEVFRAGKTLEGQVGLVGSNAVQISNHEIIKDGPGGASYQIMRPQTILPHLFDGQGFWIAVHHPELPEDVIAYGFIGHGKSPAALSDLVDIDFGPSTFQLSFRAGNLSSIEFDDLRKKIGKDADMLCMNKEYKLSLAGELVSEDWMYRYNIPLFSTMDALGGEILRQARDYFGPNTSPVSSKKLDIDTLGKKIDAGEINDVEGLNNVFEEAPTVNIKAGIYTEDGKPYPGDVVSMILSIPKGTKTTFEMPVGSLLGTPIDKMIADVVKQNLKDVDWTTIESEVTAKIKDGVGEVVKAFDPFKHGGSIDSLTVKYASDPDFMDSIKAQLRASLNESLGPRIDDIKSIISENPKTKDLTLDDYPFVESITSNVWDAMTSGEVNTSSYLELRVKSAFAKEKANYISNPEYEKSLQENIAKQLKELGNLSTLDTALSQTSAELKEAKEALSVVENELIHTPDDSDLQKQQKDLEQEIAKQVDKLDALNEKQREQEELEQEQNNLNTENLDHESNQADGEATEKGNGIFDA